MTETGVDQDLWAEVVAAEKRLAKAQADFYRQAELREEILVQALELGPSKAWDYRAALSFVLSFPHDVPKLVEQLVEHSMSDERALDARRAIAAGRRADVLPLLRQAVRNRLAAADVDVDDYRRLAELLRHVNDDEMFHILLETVSRSDDPDVQELAGELSSW